RPDWNVFQSFHRHCRGESLCCSWLNHKTTSCFLSRTNFNYFGAFSCGYRMPPDGGSGMTKARHRRGHASMTTQAQQTPRKILGTYDKVSGTVYDYTAGLPAKLLRGALGVK